MQNDELTTVLGGAELEITYTDGSKETVKVRQIPIRHMEKYLAAIDDEPTAVELYCQQEKGWADRLSEDSFNAVADKGQELNLPFFERWLRRRMSRLEVLKPGLTSQLDSAMQTAIASASQSHASSPARA